MTDITNEIKEAFDRYGLKYRVQEEEDSIRIIVGVRIAYTTLNLWYIINSGDPSIAVRVPDFVRFKTDAERIKMQKKANELHQKYCFAKSAHSGEDQAVLIEYDCPAALHEQGETAIEMFHRITQIAEMAYPSFMRALWGGEEFFGNAVFYEYKY